MSRSKVFTLIELPFDELPSVRGVRIEDRAVRKRNISGFTLIELLIVIAIIALMLSLLLPTLARAQELTNRTVCRGNARKLASACILYAQDWDGYGPPVGGQGGFYKRLAPYLGASEDDPLPKQIWFRTTGCPSWRAAYWSSVFNAGLAINNHLCNPFYKNVKMWYRLTHVEVPSELIMAHDHWSGGTNFGPFPPSSLLITVEGRIRGQTVLVYPRHFGEGLNFAFVDGHAQFHPYVPIPGSRGVFVGGNIRRRARADAPRHQLP